MSVITARLAEDIGRRGLPCERINLSPGRWTRGLSYHAVRAVRMGLGTVRILMAPGRHRYVMNVDAGLGLIYNIALALAARITGQAVLLYHHSTRYVLAPSRLMRILLATAGRGAPQVFCSVNMAALFRAQYGTTGPVIIINNAAWVERAGAAAPLAGHGKLRLGFLSNLIAEKGVGRAIETLAEARKRGLDAELVMAGAATDVQVRAVVTEAERTFGGNFLYRGPLQGGEKRDFYAALDFFLFPSLYANETQSLVVPEALAAGTPVIAYDHRFVGEVLGDGGLLVGAGEDFAVRAVDWIAARQDQAARDVLRARARAQFEKERAQAEGQIDCLIAWVCGG